MTTNRPTKRNAEIVSAVAKEISPRVAGWLNENEEAAPEINAGQIEQDIADALNESVDWDGYYLAQRLEENGYIPDFGLCEILEGCSGELHDIERAVVKKWVEENKITVPFTMGQRVKYSSYEGEVTRIDHECATVTVTTEGFTPGCGWVAPIEQCTPVETSEVKAG